MLILEEEKNRKRKYVKVQKLTKVRVELSDREKSLNWNNEIEIFWKVREFWT